MKIIRKNFFVVIFRGTKMCAFKYELDFHSDQKFNLKSTSYQDLIGLQCDVSGVSAVPQSNTFYPNLRVYDCDTTASNDDRLAVSSILTYISGFRDMS